MTESQPSQTPWTPPPQPSAARGRGATILTLGIVGLVTAILSIVGPCCCLCAFGAPVSVVLGLMAWLMGNADLERVRLGLIDPTGYGQTQAGRVCGIVAVIVGGVMFVVDALLGVLSAVLSLTAQHVR